MAQTHIARFNQVPCPRAIACDYVTPTNLYYARATGEGGLAHIPPGEKSCPKLAKCVQKMTTLRQMATGVYIRVRAAVTRHR